MKTPIDGFDFNLFESKWEKLSIGEKTLIVENAVTLSPETAILPILKGLTSHHLSLKIKAKGSLETLKKNIRKMLADARGADDCEDRKSVTLICARIYALIRSDMCPDVFFFLFTALLTFGPEGCRFAFKAVRKGLVSVPDMEQLVAVVPEADRLSFVQHYLEASPDIRLKFGCSFRRILVSLRRRDTVIRFYAGLFDRQKNADPFLHNISVQLRSPGQIISGEIRSPHPELRIIGLKALSMIKGKIHADLLINLLADEKDEAVRITIYNIIEASAVGYYRELCYPILRFFYERKEAEAIHAFKAMIVSGKLPPYRILKMVSAKYPSLLPVIHSEISTLSRFSFLFIQDIALNQKEYEDVSFDANLACVLGIIKKRPERIIKLFSRNSACDREASVAVKARSLLAKEKNSIVSESDAILKRINITSENLPVSARAIIQKKITRLKSGEKPGDEICFENEFILNADLSSLKMNSPGLFFNGSIIVGTCFSQAVFFNTVFRKSIFCNVDMQAARFDRVNFDHTVFINVNALGAEFKNCSFENASLYNCDFSQASLKDVSFAGAVISKSVFRETDLSDSCFAHSRLSAVSFSTAVLGNADFSDVRARFCKFQLNHSANIRTENLDFNARQFQLSDRDLSLIEPWAVAKINKEIFCEFIHYGKQKFLNQNRLSLLTAFDIFNKKQVDLFRLIPLLLNENITMPGFRACHPQTPCGIWNYFPDTETQDLLNRYIPGNDISPGRCREPRIEGLFTIGSVGSIAQTSDSDIDYWVCIHEKKFDSWDMGQLKMKLRSLESMALDMFHTKVTFFVVDILKARNNDFGNFSVESSGSAQSRLLKEEFYRTMIYVAGKIPLWAVLPSAVSVNYYDIISNTVVFGSSDSRYIDLGDINAISTGEYFGGSLWQMFKCLKSPFKSVLKMALLEKFIHEYGKQILLCNKYKDEWMNSGAHLQLTQSDSYYILVENLLAHFKAVDDNDSVTLLKTCFFLKLGISEEPGDEDTVFGFRNILLEKCMRRWEWTKEEVFRVGGFKNWEYRDIARLSNSIKDYMINTYKTVNKKFSRQRQLKINPEDRTVLGRKVFIEFSKQPGRVEKAFIISRSDHYYQRLHLRYLKSDTGKGMWELFNRNTRKLDFKEERLIRADTVEEIGIWLISNGLYNEANAVSLVPNPSYVTVDDIRKLYEIMYDFFSPPLEKPVGFDQLLTVNKVIGLFVSMNFYVPEPQERISDYTLVYLNSWGELFYESVASASPLTLAEAKKDILDRMGLENMPFNTLFYSSKNPKKQKNKIQPNWDVPYYDL
ncbi:MAG: class I adenylate cyclase [Desulfobacterales bacterium]|nr:class I adenylate cyclase [Desulfobacterales bacterium]